MRIDRVQNGLLPACVQTCPTGAMNFGDREAMLDLANKRLAVVKKANPKAQLIDADMVEVIYLVANEPSLYHENAVASNSTTDMTRYAALRKMFSPLGRAAAQLA